MTAEEFIREKIRQKFELKGTEPINALWMYNVNGEEALRWAYEYKNIPDNKCIHSNTEIQRISCIVCLGCKKIIQTSI